MIASRALPPFAVDATSLADASRRLLPFACLAAIGIEIALIAAFLPDTLDRLLHGPPADFHNLYRVANERQVPGLYSPFLVLLFQPLVALPEMVAFRAFFIVNIACVAAVALLMASAANSWEARGALFLAPFALPQMHWALRLGHLTALMVFVALAALLLLRARPKTAAVVLALLSLKPQYLIAPVLYLGWRRRFRLLAITGATSAALALAGFAVLGLAAVSDFVALYLDWGPNSTDNLLPVQQSWMISWTGVQISMGFEPNPFITLDVIVLSLAIALLAWARATEAAAVAAVGLMFIPLTPYAQFYDGAFVLVAIALVARAGLSLPLTMALCSGLYLAAVATQANVNFPTPDVLGDARTSGLYSLTPAMVLATAIIAIVARKRDATEAA